MKIIVLLSVISVELCYSRKLPSFIEVCKRNDPDIKRCLFKNVDIVKSRLLDGVPELGIPSFNPLFIPEARLEGAGDNFRAAFKNIKIYHAEEFVLDSLDFDLERFHLDVSITFPRLRVTSDYSFSGKLLILELNGQGPADGNFTNVKGHLTVDGAPYNKNGKKHVKLEKENIDLNVGKPHFRFENIFGDNEELNESTNKIINENIESVLEEFKPILKKVVSEFIFGLTDRVFAKYSFDELFPAS